MGTLFQEWYSYRTAKPIIQLPKSVVSVFRNLEELNICNTNEGDDLLCSLGIFCKEIKYIFISIYFMFFLYQTFLSTKFYIFRVLEARSCPNVTDIGIKGLCVSVDGLGKCKSIRTLSICRTGVSIIGVKMALAHSVSARYFISFYSIVFKSSIFYKSHFIKRIQLSKVGKDDYNFRLVKSPYLPQGIAKYKITKGGIVPKA